MKKIVLILFAVLCGAVAAVAQKAVVESFEAAPMDVTAQKYARLDLHGEKCALVKVSVVAPNVTFQGNVMGDVQKRGSEYWVYLTSGTKMVRISADSFLAFMYDFPEPLQGGVTYMLTLQAPQPAGNVPEVVTNYLVLKVQPATAHVVVDGKERFVTDGTASVRLDNGTHTYRVEAVGYAPQEGSVVMSGSKEVRTVTLVSTMPTLTVSTTTPGTRIFVNDALKGIGKWSGELLPDTYTVEGRLDGHRSYSSSVTLAESRSKSLVIPALTPITGALNIDYTPVDATITIDGRATGTTPNVVSGLTVGTHRVEIAAPGYVTATLTATVADGQTATLTGALSPRPTDPYVADIALTKEYERFYDASIGKYGYKHNGTIVIPAKYDDAWEFSEGLAWVKTGGKYGYIDKSGALLIPAKYDVAWSFSEGLARVITRAKYGYIDKSGAMVIPAKYDNAGNFSEGLARVEINGKYGYIDKSGAMVIPAKYDAAGYFSEGLAVVFTGGKWGFIDKSGAMVIPAKYDNAGNFSEGLARVKTGGKMGFIDKSGTLVIPAKYDDAGDFSNGLAWVETGGKRGFIDKRGAMVIPAKYDDAGDFSNGKAEVRLNGRRFFIDRNGNRVK